MSARIVSRVAFAIGMMAIFAAPFVPMIYRWYYPPRTPQPDPQGFWQTLGVVLDSLNSFTDGIAIFVWICGLLVLAIAASTVAFCTAWYAKEPLAWRLWCWLPVFTGVAMWVGLALLER